MDTIKKFDEFVEEQKINGVVSSNHDDYEMVNEMARIGYMTPQLEVWIKTDDSGNIPHFHVWNKDRSFHTCIQIKKPMYFHHTGKEGVFNKDELGQLITFLKSTDEKIGMTYWRFLLISWNANNSDLVVDIHQEMPDYRNIEDNK